MDRVDWDLFQLHIMETDRINHFLWRHWKDGDPVYGPIFLDFYERVDAYLGTLMDRIGDGVELMILSDHGFCALNREVYLNHWLEKEGLLRMRKDSDSVGDIHPQSRAYSLFPGRIYVNMKGREATGTVGGGREYEMTREGLAEALSAIRDPENGQPIIRQVIKREEVYRGPYLDLAPDLIAIPHNGYDLKGNFSRSMLTVKSEVGGMHTYDDAFLYVRNREIQKDNNGFGIMDAYGAVLKLMDVKKPAGVEAEELF